VIRVNNLEVFHGDRISKALSVKLCEIGILAKPSSPKSYCETVMNEVSILAIMWGSTTSALTYYNLMTGV
jgi:predicted metalloenzyme YecM